MQSSVRRREASAPERPRTRTKPVTHAVVTSATTGHGIASGHPHDYGAPRALPGKRARPSASAHSDGSASKLYYVCKRVMDIVGALILVLVLAPLLFVVALAVKATSRGPVLFSQPRLARGGRLFRCFKFRTMVADAEQLLDRDPRLRKEFAAAYKLKDDPRVTPLGRFLRKSSLDELPQLINVMKGDMSLIGPRPIVPAELAKYGRYADKLLTATPGLGGLWQASGRSDISYDERVDLDMRYIDNRSLRMDMLLLVKTAAAVTRRRGAY